MNLCPYCGRRFTMMAHYVDHFVNDKLALERRGKQYPNKHKGEVRMFASHSSHVDRPMCRYSVGVTKTKAQEFPKMAGHEIVRCRNCHQLLPGGPFQFAAPEGKFGKACTRCYLVTWYDLAPPSYGECVG